MSKTAILVDGGFYRRRSESFWHYKEPSDRADELVSYAKFHITCNHKDRLEDGRRSLYRIFYYDCPPLTGTSVWQPWNDRNTAFEKRNLANKWADDFHSELSGRLKVAMRMGVIQTAGVRYVPNSQALKDLAHGKRTVQELRRGDYSIIGMKQSGVDMKIGIDVASLSAGRIVDQIILISDDSDFIPAIKVARRAGIDFLLDPMGSHPAADLVKQVDGIEDLHDTFITAAGEDRILGEQSTVH